MAWDQVLDEVMRTRRHALVGYASLFTLDRVAAEDLVQEALVRTFARPRSLPDAVSAEAYVRSAIRSSFLDGTRRRRTWAGREHLFAVPARAPLPDETVAASVDVAAALALLPARERACAVLRFADDRTVAEIADELGLSEGSVKRYLHDATVTLRRVLGDVVPDADTALGLTSVEVLTKGQGR